MLHDKTRWLDEALAQIPADLEAGDGTTHRQTVDSYLRPLLKRCRATTRPRFWQWLRLQLSKSEEMAGYLTWTRESQCAPELPLASEIPYTLSVDGSIALIAVGDDTNHAVWRVPVAQLSWALGQFPVYLKQLPAVESDTQRQIRTLKRQFKSKMPYLTLAQRAEFVRELEQLESVSQVDTSPPRYHLMKSVEGRDVAVHRLFVDAGRDDHVDAVDGDFLNFGTTQVRVTVSSVTENGIGVRKGDRPLNESFVAVVPNLLVVNNEGEQRKFEDAFLQSKTTPQGDVDETPLRVLPNASWTDAGPFEPLTSEEIKVAGRSNVELPSDQPDDGKLTRLWREQSPQAKDWDSRYWRTIPTKK